MDAVDVLMEARAYIEKGWTQGYAARNVGGQPVAFSSPDARTRCAVGALLSAVLYETNWFGALSGAEALLTDATNCVSIPNWNDMPGRTREEVLEAFDKAIGLGLERAGER